jgi:ferredoxin--NADP+ reductase
VRNRVIVKEAFSPGVWHLVVENPEIAAKARAGQFVIIRIAENGERIPLTIADADPKAGTISLVVQEIGKTTAQLGDVAPGSSLADVAGPLGHPTELANYGTVAVVGGGVGIAAIFPIARALAGAGNQVISILGARNKEILFWVNRFEEFSARVLVTTDDGSSGNKGFVTDVLRDLLDRGTALDRVWAVGPVVMMEAVSKVTVPRSIPTIVSLNPVMVDGTGMCGACRVTVGGKTRFVCVDGPEFEAADVDFKELRSRLSYYRPEEKESFTSYCRRTGRPVGE